MYYLLFSDNLTKSIDNNNNIIYQGKILDELKSNVIGEYFISRNDDIGVGQVELNVYNSKNEEPIALDLNKLNGISFEAYLMNYLWNFISKNGVCYMFI